MYDRKGREKKGQQHNQTKIRGKEERFLTSPKKDMYRMHRCEEKTRICK